MINFNKNNGMLSYGFAESRTPEEISPEQWEFQSFVFSSTWRSDIRFLDMLTCCMETQFATYLEEEIMMNFDLLLIFKFSFKLRVMDILAAFAEYEVIVTIPRQNHPLIALR
uniref:Uncharacterized protein n=1 Tax=Glossina austeni TaxID=7395 RepID=A0A1A9VNN4_GLOAU